MARRSPVPARRRQRGVVRCFARLAELGFQLGDAGVLCLDLCEQLVDPRQQLLHQRLQAVTIQRIKLPGRHPELESEGFCEVAWGCGFGKGTCDVRPRRNLIELDRVSALAGLWGLMAVAARLGAGGHSRLR
jgi:hypothetical protein